MKLLSEKIVAWLYKQNAISEEGKDLYEYAAYCFLITTIPLIMAFLASVMIGGGRQYIAILIPFIILRRYCGGYHAKNALVCMITSFVTLLLSVRIAMMKLNCFIYRIIVIVAFIILLKNSPIESDNRKIDEDEKILYQKKAIIIACVFVFIIMVFDIMGLNEYSVSMGMGVILVAVSQLLYIISDYKNHV